MTWYLDRWNTGTDEWDAVSIDANGINAFSLKIGYAGPSTLSFEAMLPQHATSIGGMVNTDLIRLRSSDYDGGNGLGVDPVFEGRVAIEPGTATIGVKCLAIDPTGFSNYPLMSSGWELESGEVVPVTGGRPRVVWNCKLDTDDDYATARSYNATVGEIIEALFTDHKEALKKEFAGPADGSDPFVAADLTPLTFKPQEKFAADGETLRPALTALLQQYYPTWRIRWEPGTRLWRFVDLKDAPEATLTLNDNTGDDVVLSFEPHVSVEDRFTAVEIYGPSAMYQWDEYHEHPYTFTQLDGAVTIGATSIVVDDGTIFPAIDPLDDPDILPDNFTILIDGELCVVTAVTGTLPATLTLASALENNHSDNAIVSLTAEMTLRNGGLTDQSGTDYELEEWGAGEHVYGMYKLQITDEDRRQILRILKDAYNAPTPGMTSGNASTGFDVITTNYETAVSPVLMVKFPANNMGDGKWQALDGWEYSANDGRIYFGSIAQPRFLFRYNPNPPLRDGLTGPHVEEPDDVQLVWCSPANPLKVRYPTSGFAGTAYTLYNVEKVQRFSDEMLALNYERDPLLTSSDRLTHFTTLAQQKHAQLCDVVFAGVAILSGMRWDYLALAKRINVAAVDQDGEELETGWEAAKAWLTEVTFDPTENKTTLVLNNNQLELMGLDVAKMKQQLGIRKLTPVYASTPFVTYTPKPVGGNYQAGQSDATKAALASDFRSGSITQLVGYVDEQGRRSNG